MIIVVKIGTSSVTLPDGGVDRSAIRKLAREVASSRGQGHRVVLVSSGAVTAGRAVLTSRASEAGASDLSHFARSAEAFARSAEPAARSAEPAVSVDPVALQALSAIGQHRLMHVYDEAFAEVGLIAGQVLLAPTDFAHRGRYLHARETLFRLMDLGIVPVVNENDVIADDEIRFGDNDRLAALVAHLLRAQMLVLLTDTAGLFSADPRIDAGATLIEEVAEIDHELELSAGGPGSDSARGGMVSKLAAAKMAAWSGVTTIIAAAERPEVLADALAGTGGRRTPGAGAFGTVFLPHNRSLSARKLWIAFALRPVGRLVVDEGARTALVERRTSLLAAGVRSVEGRFVPDDAVEISDSSGLVFAKGISQLASDRAQDWVGKRSSELPPDLRGEVVHRDDLVVLVG